MIEVCVLGIGVYIRFSIVKQYKAKPNRIASVGFFDVEFFHQQWVKIWNQAVSDELFIIYD